MKPTRIWSSQQQPEDVYVLDIEILPTQKGMISLLSNGRLRIISDFNRNEYFDFSLLNPSNIVKRITGISCPSLENGLIWSCSSEGMISGWDFMRTPTQHQPSLYYYSNSCNFSCVDVGLQDDSLICSGTEEGFDSKIYFWDVRNMSTPLSIYQESHSDSITKVKFARNNTSSISKPALLSGSVDGLVCYFDLSQPSETAALKSVLNANSACANLGFFGANYEGIYVTTTTETLSLFEIDSCSTIKAYENDLINGTGCRELLQSIEQNEINYLVDCLWEAKTQKLILCAGDAAGNGYGFEVVLNGFNRLGPLAGGHTEVIRASKIVDLGAQRGLGIVTGGEDGRVCLWTTD
jgi:WD40 repeat protein